MSDITTNSISLAKAQFELEQLLAIYLSEKEENRITKDKHGMEYWDGACQTIYEVAGALKIPLKVDHISAPEESEQAQPHDNFDAKPALIISATGT